jgi:hypothetical protein
MTTRKSDTPVHYEFRRLLEDKVMGPLVVAASVPMIAVGYASNVVRGMRREEGDGVTEMPDPPSRSARIIEALSRITDDISSVVSDTLDHIDPSRIEERNAHLSHMTRGEGFMSNVLGVTITLGADLVDSAAVHAKSAVSRAAQALGPHF